MIGSPDRRELVTNSCAVRTVSRATGWQQATPLAIRLTGVDPVKETLSTPECATHQLAILLALPVAMFSMPG